MTRRWPWLTRRPPIANNHPYTEVEVRDLLDAVEHFFVGHSYTDQDKVLRKRAPIKWEVGLQLGDTVNDLPIRALGLLWQLEAVLTAPETLIAVARELHARVQAVAPVEELVGEVGEA